MSNAINVRFLPLGHISFEIMEDKSVPFTRVDTLEGGYHAFLIDPLVFLRLV